MKQIPTPTNNEINKGLSTMCIKTENACTVMSIRIILVDVGVSVGVDGSILVAETKVKKSVTNKQQRTIRIYQY